MVLKRLSKTMTRRARSREGFTLIEVMLCAAVLVVATTASMQIYLQTCFLVETTKQKTVAVLHQKMIMEEIRSWRTFTNDEIISCKGYDGGWQGWLTNQVGIDELLEDEAVTVTSVDWVENFPTSPRRVVATINWTGVRGDTSMKLVGGF